MKGRDNVEKEENYMEWKEKREDYDATKRRKIKRGEKGALVRKEEEGRKRKEGIVVLRR